MKEIQQVERLRKFFFYAYAKGNYSACLAFIWEFLERCDKDRYIKYMINTFDWKSYFNGRKWKFKKYGYFVYGLTIRQIFFQFIRGNSRFTKAVFSSLRNKPESFFSDWVKYEKDSWLDQMVPRAIEIFDYLDDYRRIGRMLVSAESNRVYACLMMAYITMDLKYFHMANEMVGNTEYFPDDIFAETPSGVFVDAGGFDGDTALLFLSKYNNFNNEYYLFEPGKDNINRAIDNLKGYRKVRFIHGALGQFDGDVFISGDGEGITVTDESNKKVHCYTVDGMVDERVGFIKMDIEGAELGAIKGAAEHILSDKPQMAICAYHKPDDIRVLTDAVMSIRADYKLHIRHYGDKYKECVLYFT